MAPIDSAVLHQPDPYQHVTSKALDQRHSFSLLGGIVHHRVHCSFRQLLQDLLDDRKTLLDLADSNPKARIDIPRLQYWYIEPEFVIGRITRRATCIERAARGATHEAACAELCGMQHFKMRARVLVMSEANFDAWLKSRSAQ